MKRLSAFGSSIAALLSIMPSTVKASDTAVTHYVQCLIATSTLVASQDSTIKLAGLMASNFFAGQIFGASPDIDLTAAMRREARLLDEAKIKALLVQCGGEMTSRGNQISAAGQALNDDAVRARPAS